MSRITVTIDRETLKPVFVNEEGSTSHEGCLGAEFVLDKRDVFAQRSTSDGIAVTVLPDSSFMSIPRIVTLTCGTVEQYRTEIGFSDPTLAPTIPTVAVWMIFRHGIPVSHEFLVGGPCLEIAFQICKFFGRDEKNCNPGMVITARQDPSAIKFRSGSNVTSWEPIQMQFRNSISSIGASISFEEGPGVYVRWAIEGDPESNDPGRKALLSLQGMVLKDGPRFENLSAETKQEMLSGSSLSFHLWSMQTVWYAPSMGSHLATQPGLFTPDLANTSPPSDIMLRYGLQTILQQTRRGQYTDGMDWDAYMENPKAIYPAERVPFSLVLPLTESPEY